MSLAHVFTLSGRPLISSRTCIAVLLAAIASTISSSSLSQQEQSPRTIRVLWYSYAHPESSYRRAIDRLARHVHTLPQGGGYAWRLSWYGPDWPAPRFERYDVLVIQSGEAFGSGDPKKGGDGTGKPDFIGILKHRAAIESARGTRTVITGSDPDIHAIAGATGNAPVKEGHLVRCNPPLLGRTCWDGALGHLVNAINWAGTGKGMGIVSLVAAEFPGSDWWLHPDSFLRQELTSPGRGVKSFQVFGPGTRENQPVIPAGFSAHPLNFGLTSKGLSNWNSSFHAGFYRHIKGYFSYVDSTRYPDLAMAIASDRQELK